MVKVGFIDYYLDEWHANNYPEFFKNETDGEFKVCYAYAKIDNPDGITNKEWAKMHGIELLDTIEEVVEKSDCLVILSPDNSEMHEELSDIPLKSGKFTYIDKTFAPDKASAVRMFEKAEKYGTKCYSSSSLRYATEWKDIDKKAISKIYSSGAGDVEGYAVHQLEPIMMLMECDPKRVMFLGNANNPSYIVEFEDGRFAQCTHVDDPDGAFELTIADKENKAKNYKAQSDFFAYFIKAMVEFFKTGNVEVDHKQTINVMATIEAAKKASMTPFEWVLV